MSQPFAKLVADLVAKQTDQQLTENAFAAFNRWALLSADKRVSLTDVAWPAALMVKALKASGIDLMKTETRDENGARVVGITASDGVRVADGAG